MLDSPTFDIARALRPARRSIGFARLYLWAQRGLAAGALLGTFILASAHIWYWGGAPPVALFVLAGGALAGAVIGMVRWPRLLEVARAVDRHLDLDDRLTTALELRASVEPFAVLQRGETSQRVSQLRLRAGKRRYLNGVTAVAILAVLSFAGILSVGSSATPRMNSTTTASRERIQLAARVILPELSHRLKREIPPSQRHSAPLRALERALIQLRQELRQVNGPAQALRAITLTQRQIERLEANIPALTPRDLARLNKGLGVSGRSAQESSSPAHRPSYRASTSRQSAEQRLHHLANGVGSMKAAQVRQLARKLEQTARHLSQPLSHILHQASRSLSLGRRRAAKRLLSQAASVVHESQSLQGDRTRLQQTESGLNSLKSSVTGLNGKLPTAPNSLAQGRLIRHLAAAGRAGKYTQSGKAEGGLPKGSGLGKNLREAGPAVLQNRHHNGKSHGGGIGQVRRPVAAMSKANGFGSYGSPGGQDQGHSFHGRYTQVFVPGHARAGPRAVQIGLGNRAQGGHLVPYRQVVTRYVQTARGALDRTSLPPSVESYLRRYFSVISH